MVVVSENSISERGGGGSFYARIHSFYLRTFFVRTLRLKLTQMLRTC